MIDQNCSQCSKGAPCEVHEGVSDPRMAFEYGKVGDDLMDEAWGLTNGDRRAAYGDPREVFDGYGLAWSAILRHKLRPGEIITGAEATLMMAALKLCREAANVGRDNVVDAHGYLSLHSRVVGLLK